MGQDEGKRVYGIIDPRGAPQNQVESVSLSSDRVEQAAIPVVVLPGQMIADDLGRQPAPAATGEPVSAHASLESAQGSGPAPGLQVEAPPAPRKKTGRLVAASILLALIVLGVIAGAAYWITTSFNKLDEDILAAKTQVDNMQGELSEAKNGITILENNLSQNKIDYTTLEGDYNSTEDQHNSLSTDYTVLQSQNEQHETDLSTAKEMGITLGYDLKRVNDSNQTFTSKLERGQKYAKVLNAFMKWTFGPKLSGEEVFLLMFEWSTLINETDDSTLEQYYDDFIQSSQSAMRKNYNQLITYLIEKCIQIWQ